MSIVVYYPEAAQDDLWMGLEGLTSLYAGLEVSDLQWFVSFVRGRSAAAVQAIHSQTWLYDLKGAYSALGQDILTERLRQAPGAMSLSAEEVWLTRFHDASAIHAVGSTTLVRLAGTRRRGGDGERPKLVWSPTAGEAPGTWLARRLALATARCDAASAAKLTAFQRWIDNRALELADLILVDSAADLEAFATTAPGRAAVAAASPKVRIQPSAVPAPSVQDVAAVRRRLGLEAAFVLAHLGVAGEGVVPWQDIDGGVDRPALAILRSGRAWVRDAQGWSERGECSPQDLLAACDIWVDTGDGQPEGRRLAIQALSLGKPGLSSDPALRTLEGMAALVSHDALASATSALLQASPEELARRGAANRRAYLDRFAPAEAARRYVETVAEVAGPLAPLATRRAQRRPRSPDAPLLVSVILPAYNVEDYLGQCLASICGQSYPDIEIIVVNDGGADGSVAIAHAWARRDERIVVLDQLNAGLSAARNAALDVANGDFICFVDGDDWVAPDYVERLLRLAIDKEVDLVACAIEYHFPDGAARYHSTLHGGEAVRRLIQDNVLDLGDKTVLAELFPSAWNKLYKRDLFDRVRYPEGMYYEDHPVFFIIGLNLDRIGYLPQALYHQRLERPGSITRQTGRRLFDIFPVLEQVFTIIAARVQPPASHAMFKQVALRLLWERSNLIDDGALAERYAGRAARLLRETGVDAVEPRARDTWIPSAARLRFEELEESPMQCSVVLTYANDAEYIGPLLDALERQTLRQIEVLVVDNGSVDGATAVVAAKCGRDPRFKRLVHQGPVGGARNTGAAAATGKYLIFMEGNDLVARDALERLSSYADDEDADVTVCAFEYFGPGWTKIHNGFHTSLPSSSSLAEGSSSNLLPIAGQALVSDLLAFPCNKLFKRSFFKDRALQFEDHGFYEEHAFWLDVADCAPRVVYTPEPLYRVRDEMGARRLWNGSRHAFDAVQALRSVAKRLNGLEDQPLLAKLCVRIAWERLTFGLTSPVVRKAFAEACKDAVGELDLALLHSERDDYISEDFIAEFERAWLVSDDELALQGTV